MEIVMKKLICLALALLMMTCTLVLVGCGGEEEAADNATLKMGLGVYTKVTDAADATEDKNGQGSVEITAAAVTLDENGKIVTCVIDTAANTVKYTYEGKALANDSFKTKYEMGKDYNMIAYGGAAKEWFEQADAFANLVKGKTVKQVKALVVNGDKGTEDVIAAGCTITVNEFVLAIEKACNNAVAGKATATDTLKLGVFTEQSTSDATEDKNGKNQTETTFFAAAVNAKGKIVAATADCVQVKFDFDVAGIAKTDITKAVASKREQGDSYGMVAYGGAAKEWYAQADAFAAACIGKSASDIASFMGDDNYGNADIKSAGCTVLVNGFVKAAAKIK